MVEGESDAWMQAEDGGTRSKGDQRSMSSVMNVWFEELISALKRICCRRGQSEVIQSVYNDTKTQRMM